MRETITVDTSNIKVGKKYYSFDYTIYRNSQKIGEGNFENSHSRSATSIRKWLNEGWATELVLEHKF